MIELATSALTEAQPGERSDTRRFLMRLRTFLLAMGLIAAAGGAGQGAVAANAHGQEKAPTAGKTSPSPWVGKLSGLPWASGSSSSGRLLERLRGRPLDVLTLYLRWRGNWADMVASAANVAKYARALPEGGKIAVSVGLVPQSHRGELSACAAGQFDQHLHEIGTTLLAGSENHQLLVRLGWEANNVGSFPWAVVDDGTSWKDCYRHWVAVLRGLPGSWRMTMVWNMATRGSFPYPIDAMYPGSDVVNVIGVEFFDRCPVIADEATWERRLNATRLDGSPMGLGSWLAYAKSKGRPLAIPEWAIGGLGQAQACGPAAVDNAFLIRKMFAWLQENADHLAWEAYFNSDPYGHALMAPDGRCPHPRAAAAYAELW
jgi:hypothetical protein